MVLSPMRGPPEGSGQFVYCSKALHLLLWPSPAPSSGTRSCESIVAARLGDGLSCLAEGAVRASHQLIIAPARYAANKFDVPA
jgi:hypothetical protein